MSDELPMERTSSLRRRATDPVLDDREAGPQLASTQPSDQQTTMDSLCTERPFTRRLNTIPPVSIRLRTHVSCTAEQLQTDSEQEDILMDSPIEEEVKVSHTRGLPTAGDYSVRQFPQIPLSGAGMPGSGPRRTVPRNAGHAPIPAGAILYQSPPIHNLPPPGPMHFGPPFNAYIPPGHGYVPPLAGVIYPPPPQYPHGGPPVRYPGRYPPGNLPPRGPAGFPPPGGPPGPAGYYRR